MKSRAEPWFSSGWIIEVSGQSLLPHNGVLYLTHQHPWTKWKGGTQFHRCCITREDCWSAEYPHEERLCPGITNESMESSQRGNVRLYLKHNTTFFFYSFLKLSFLSALLPWNQGVGICLLDFLVVVSLCFLDGGQSQNKQGRTGDGSCLQNNVCQSGLCFSTLAVPASDISLSR